MYRYFKDFLTNNIFIPLATWLVNEYKIDVTANDLMKVVKSRGKYIKSVDDNTNDEEIEVYPGYYRVPNVYREVKHNFIIQQLSSSELIVIGVVDNGHDRLPNDEERKIAVDIGLMVV